MAFVFKENRFLFQSKSDPSHLKKTGIHVMLTLEKDKYLNISELRTVKHKLELLNTMPSSTLGPTICALEEKMRYLQFIEEVNTSYGLKTTHQELLQFLNALPKEEAERFQKSFQTFSIGSAQTQLERRFALRKLLEKHGKSLEWLRGEVSKKNYEKLLEGNTPFALRKDGNLWIGDQTITFVRQKDLLEFN